MAVTDTDAVVSDVALRYLQLHLTSDVGPVRVRKLREHFGSLDAVLLASIAELTRVEGIGTRIAESILRSRSHDVVEAEVERAAACGLRIVCPKDTDYPKPLLHMPDPPVCLYVRGRLEPADGVAVAIVGTRRCSHYGREQALRFGELLGAAGFTVVSGLARGIDGYAHRGALQGGGRTIAVLGCGLGSMYPREHQSLSDQIAQDGAVVSELPVDAQPEAGNFPRRNRIIAGLSLGVIIIEAGKKSGAMITARLANEYNREVFALPGRVDRPESTAGVHALIRDGGAKLITCLEDVLDELADVGRIMGRDTAGASTAGSASDKAPSSPVPKLAVEERMVWDAITAGAEDVDSLLSTTGLEPARVMSTLTSLQIKGLIRQLPGGLYARRY